MAASQRNDPAYRGRTITESSYTNPHGTISCGLRRRQGVGRGARAGVAHADARLDRSLLKPGTVVTVLGYQHRKVGSEMRAENITVDKKKIELR